ncbi:hypothetical protein CIRG_06361 [Coccidioides immitis RMSCC 2394]|uniref:Uncharacterized protein n=1 Tax=Coccidioides immitis RMSCC 2394 TaxID=404692 RepID=A0A0J6YGD5_COCIT|nr:hypothetical protein CIRG_06361 [Coccidioides immitis RMSCC 2394]
MIRKEAKGWLYNKKTKEQSKATIDLALRNSSILSSSLKTTRLVEAAKRSKHISREKIFLLFYFFLVAEYVIQQDKDDRKATVEVNQLLKNYRWDYKPSSLANIQKEIKLVDHIAACLYNMWGQDSDQIYEAIFKDKVYWHV